MIRHIASAPEEKQEALVGSTTEIGYFAPRAGSAGQDQGGEKGTKGERPLQVSIDKSALATNSVYSYDGTINTEMGRAYTG
jgi:hypothetical protein